jgi:hypothetical protein
MTQDSTSVSTPPNRPPGFTFGLRLKGWVTLVVLLALVFWSLAQTMPPSPVDVNAPANVFSAERAMQKVEVFAQKPHPLGSDEEVKVRDYLVGQLKDLGLSPEVQTGMGVYPQKRSIATGTVHNIVARMKGTDNTKAVQLMAHYDSVPTGPGASDDGAAVAAILETIRALKAGPALKNDVIVVFTDGEEADLLGADAYFEDNPTSKDVGLVLNLEARGSKGPSMMFQTSDNNGWMIEQFAKVAPRPVTSSLFGDLYKYLPNDTDLTVALKHKYYGLNFAFGDGWTAYHTTQDSLENIDHASLQHHGENALALVKQFGNQNLNQTQQADDVYFSLFGMVMHYPKSWVMSLTIVIALLLIGAWIYGVRNNQLTWKGLGGGVLFFLTSLLGAVLLSYLVWLAVSSLWAGKLKLPYGGTYYGMLYQIAFVLLSLVAVTLVQRWFRKRISLANLLGGSLFWWALFLIGMSVVLPGGSYLFAWPLLISLLVLIFAVRTKQAEQALKHPLALLITAVPVVMIYASLTYILFIFEPVSMAPYLMAIVMFALVLLLPHFEAIAEIRKELLPLIGVVGAIVLLIVGAVNTQYDKAHPQADNLFYLLNTDTGKSSWVSFSNLDEWNKQAMPQAQEKKFNDLMPFNQDIDVFTDSAPVQKVDPAHLQVLSDTTVGDERTLHLKVTSPHQSTGMLMVFQGAEVNQITMNGKVLPQTLLKQPDAMRVSNIGYPEGGFDLTVKVKANGKLKLSLTDIASQLPEELSKTLKPRPDNIMPSPDFDQTTMVEKTFPL